MTYLICSIADRTGPILILLIALPLLPLGFFSLIHGFEKHSMAWQSFGFASAAASCFAVFWVPLSLIVICG